MRETSALYKQIRESSGWHYNVNVVCNTSGFTYDMTVLKSVHITPMLFSETGPSIGNACSAQCDISLIETSENWPRMAEFEVKVQIMSEDNTQVSEWLSMGTFYTDERSYDDYGNLKISGFDKMLQTEQSWTDKITPPNSWPVTSKAWCDLIEEAGLFEFDDRSGIDDTVAFIGLDTTSTIREKLKDIASAHGSNWTVTPEGKLRLIPFTNTIITDSAIAGIAIAGYAVVGKEEGDARGSNYTYLGTEMHGFSRSPELAAITGASLETKAGQIASAGNTTGYVLTGQCEFVNSDGLGNLCLSMTYGYVYRPFESQVAYLDPAAELGDLVEINNVNYQIMYLNWNINHRPTANISAPYEEEVDHEYEWESQEARTYRSVMQDISAQNLIPFPYDYGSGAYSDVSYTINDDGSITLNGTSSAAFLHTIIENTKHLSLGSGTYTLSLGNGSADIGIRLYRNGSSGINDYFAETFGSPYTFTLDEEKTNIVVRFHVRRAGATFNNYTIYPQLEAGAIAHTWRSPTDSFSSQIVQNANNILLKVSQGNVASQLSIECTNGTGYVNVGTNRFTVNSDNFKLDRSGNVTASGTITTRGDARTTQLLGGAVRFNIVNDNSQDEYVGHMYGGKINWYHGGVKVGETKGLLIQTAYDGGSGKILSVATQKNGVASSFSFNEGANEDVPSDIPDVNVMNAGQFYNDGIIYAGSRIVLERTRQDVINDVQTNYITLYDGYLPNDPNHTGVGRYMAIVGGLLIDGGLYVLGTKTRVVETKSYGNRCLNAVESPSPIFTDFGSGVIDADGKCYVFYDPIFAETISVNSEYQVFTTRTSEGSVDWVEKKEDHFIVHGTFGTSFDWSVYAKQKDYEAARLVELDLDKTESEEPESPIPPAERYPLANATINHMEELETDYDELAEQYLNLYEQEIEEL